MQRNFKTKKKSSPISSEKKKNSIKRVKGQVQVECWIEQNPKPKKAKTENKDGSGEGSFETRNRSQARTRSERHRPLHWLRLPSLSLSLYFFFFFISLMFLLLLIFQGKMVISLKNFGGKDCTTFLFFFLNFDLNEESYLLIYFIFVNGFLVQRILGRSHSASKLAKVL